MNKIAIFVSGSGEAAERVVKLFNEGNRVHTSLVVVDDSARGLLERLKEEDATLLHIPDSEWHQRQQEVVDLIKENGVRLLVMDDFALALSDELMESTEGRMIRLTSADLAPREVVNALEADLRKPAEEIKETTAPEDTATPESEWAEALKIQFTPPKVPVTPPVTPPEIPSEPESVRQPGEPYRDSQPFGENYGEPKREYRERERGPEEPMPSTWLIWSILVTVFCCFIPGIIAIIFSSQVSSRYYSGDIEGAKRSSYLAEVWIIVSVVLGILTATFYLPFMLIG